MDILFINVAILPLVGLPAWLLWLLLGGISGSLLRKLFKRTNNKPTVTTKSICIIGTKGAGKTTLWKKLGAGVHSDSTSATTETTVSNIEQFTLETDSGSVIISETKDVGGEDRYVEIYNQLIKEDSFVFFLVSALELKKNDKLINARLKKISDIIKGFPEDSIGFCLIITHMDECLNNNTSYDINSRRFEKYIKREDQKIRGNLLDNTFVDTIKKMIVQYKTFNEASEDEGTKKQ